LPHATDDAHRPLIARDGMASGVVSGGSTGAGAERAVIALRVLAGSLSVCRLPPEAPWPTPASSSSWFSVTRTAHELSVVCAASEEPAGAAVEPGWRCLEVAGPLDFAMVGVMSRITGCLARAGVSVFVISTYDTDYVLVREEDLDAAVMSLAGDGYPVSETPAPGD
jgi:hypothetical protein